MPPLDILYLALAEPIGLLLCCSPGDRERARQALYQARAKAGDVALAGLQIRVSPFGEGDLVVCHQRPRIAAPLASEAEEQEDVTSA